MAPRIVRVACRLAYAGLAKWLPETGAPGGRWACALRRVLVRGFVDSVAPDANIERGATILGRDVRIGRRSGIGLRARIATSCHIGDHVMMGPEVMIYSLNHRFRSPDLPMMDQGDAEDRPVVIEDDVWIGARAILLPGVRVGSGSVVGAGAVVSRDVPQGVIVAGNPAKVVGPRVVAAPVDGSPRTTDGSRR
jgi:maltose O-acetyltransferase